MERVYIFNALSAIGTDQSVGLGVFSDAFVDYMCNNSDYPSEDTPYVSPSLRALANIHALLGGGELALRPHHSPSQRVTVVNVSDTHNSVQFHGDGTAAHPDLFDRDSLFVQPVVRAFGKVALLYYVVTKNVFVDLPPEIFQVSFTGLNVAVAVTCHDPIKNEQVTTCSVVHDPNLQDAVTLQLEAADYPRIVLIE